MSIPMVFIAVLICLMALYTMNRFIKRPGIVSILLLILQFLAATVTVFSLFEDVLTTLRSSFCNLGCRGNCSFTVDLI